MEFAAQGFTERTPRQVHQPHRPPGAAHRDLVARGQLADHLAIRAQDGCGLGADDLDLNRGGQRQDQGAIGQRVRANRGEGKDSAVGNTTAPPAASE